MSGEIKFTGDFDGLDSSDGYKKIVNLRVRDNGDQSVPAAPPSKPSFNVSRELAQLEETGYMPKIEDDEAPEAGSSPQLESRPEPEQRQADRDKARRDQKARDRQQAAHDAWMYEGAPKPGLLSSYYDEGDPEYENPADTDKAADQSSGQAAEGGDGGFLERFGGSDDGGNGGGSAGRSPEGGSRKRRVAMIAAGVLILGGIAYEGVNIVSPSESSRATTTTDDHVAQPVKPTKTHHKAKAHNQNNTDNQQPEVTPTPTPTTQPTESATPSPQPTPTPTPKPPTKAELAVAAMPLDQKIDQLIDVNVPIPTEPATTAKGSGSKNDSKTSSKVIASLGLEQYQDDGNLIFNGVPSEAFQQQIADFKKNRVYSPEVTFAFDQAGQLPEAFAPGAKSADIASEMEAIKLAGADRIVLPVNLDLPQATGATTSVTKKDLLSVKDLAAQIKTIADAADGYDLKVSLNSFPVEFNSEEVSADATNITKKQQDSLSTELTKRSRLVVNRLKEDNTAVYINANGEVPKGIKLYSDNRSPALNSFAPNVLHREGYIQTPAVGLVEYALAHPKDAKGKKETLSDYAIQALHVGATSIVLEQSASAASSTSKDTDAVTISQQADQLKADIAAAVKNGDISEDDLNDAVLANLQDRTGKVVKLARQIKQQAAAEAKEAKAAEESGQPKDGSATQSAQPTSQPTATATKKASSSKN